MNIKEVKANPELTEQFIKENLGLVSHIISTCFSYTLYTDKYDDYFQVGSIGLVKAVKRFDVSHDVKFSTYAAALIKGEIMRYRRDSESVIRFPRSMNWSEHPEVLSFSVPITESKKTSFAITLEDTLADESDLEQTVVSSWSAKEKIQKLKQVIGSRNFAILVMYSKGASQQAIGQKFGISQCSISRTLIKIRKQFKLIEQQYNKAV